MGQLDSLSVLREQAGIDYLRMTMAQGGKTFDLWTADCTEFVMSRARLGNQLKEQNMLGYRGIMCGSAFVGWGRDGAMCQVTGSLAQAGFCSLYRRWHTRVTRLDTQVTIWFDGDPKNYIPRACVQARKWRLEGKTKRETEGYYHRGDTGNTTEIGSKGSAKWARIYDKGRESGEEQYINSIRYEYQHKDDVAKKVAVQVYKGIEENPQEVVRNYVIGALAEQGVIVPLEKPYGSYERVVIPRPQTDAEKKLEWLRVQVQPSVAWLCENGYREQALIALGLLNPPQVEAWAEPIDDLPNMT